MGEECPKCRTACTMLTGDPFDDDCHEVIDSFAQGEIDADEIQAIFQDEYDWDFEEFQETLAELA